MKKIINPVPNGGAPLHADRLVDVLGNEIWKAIQALPYGLTDPAGSGDTGLIISGCKITGSGPYDCSAGIVMIGGEFYEFAGFTGQTLPRYITPATTVNIQKTFKDGVARDLIVQKDATHQSGVPGGQYISLSTTGWAGILPGGRRMFPETAWTNFTLQNNWAKVANTPDPGWRVNSRGAIEFRGQIALSSGTNPQFCAGPFPRPVGFSAAVSAYFPIADISSNSARSMIINVGGALLIIGTVSSISVMELGLVQYYAI